MPFWILFALNNVYNSLLDVAGVVAGLVGLPDDWMGKHWTETSPNSVKSMF
jgi:hypothetical protein